MRRIGEDNERGAYAVLYAALMLALLGLSAIVVDFANVRNDRRLNHSATDAAAISGAEQLNTLGAGGAQPFNACSKAWQYVVSNLRNVSVPSNPCTEFDSVHLPNVAAYCAQASPTEIRAARQIPGTRIYVTMAWPVPVGSAFLTPTLAPGQISQTTDVSSSGATGYDGSPKGCDRFGVAIAQNRAFGLGSTLGYNGVTTEVHSVAKFFISNRKQVIAALNVLDRNGCDAVQTSGGKIVVAPTGLTPGIISVDSSGRQTAGGGCPPASPWVIDPQDNVNNLIRADGPGGSGQGVIQSYALNPAPIGNSQSPNHAFDAGVVLRNRLAPQPTLMTDRYGGTPVTDLYACTGVVDTNYPNVPACTTPVNYVAALKSALGQSIANRAALPTSYSGAAAPWNLSDVAHAFKTLPDPAYPKFKCTTQASDPNWSIPAGNWFVNCETLSIGNTGVFQGGVIVTRGGINLGSSTGCLVINISIADPSFCPTANNAVSPPVTVPAENPTDSILYMRGGDGTNSVGMQLYKVSQAQVFMPRTMVFQDHDATMQMGGGSGSLYWTDPLATDCTTTACSLARFQKIAFWSDTTNAQGFGGQTGLYLRGVMFMPRSDFSFDGQTSLTQNNAQFWAWRLLVNASGAQLFMAVDPGNAIPKPQGGIALIR